MIVLNNCYILKITALEESADFATLDTEKLFSKLKSHELSRKGRPNHDVSHASKAFVTSARVGGHDANPTNTTVSSTLEFVLSSLTAASDKQYESIPDNEITLLARKFRALHKFRKERRRSPRGCFEWGDTTHFIADCPKRKKLDSSSNKYDYAKQNDYNKGDDKKKYCFGNKEKKKKFQKIMSQACAALSDLDFSSDDSSSSKEDEKVKHKPGEFTGLCLRGKSARHISDSSWWSFFENRWAWECLLQPGLVALQGFLWEQEAESWTWKCFFWNCFSSICTQW
jgi:hypothetical protein